MCHGGRRETLQRVCLIDSNGHVIKSYGGSWGSGRQQMHMPTHLAVDGNESFFVADSNNRRVLSLSPALIYKGEVLSRAAEMAATEAVFRCR